MTEEEVKSFIESKHSRYDKLRDWYDYIIPLYMREFDADTAQTYIREYSGAETDYGGRVDRALDYYANFISLAMNIWGSPIFVGNRIDRTDLSEIKNVLFQAFLNDATGRHETWASFIRSEHFVLKLLLGHVDTLCIVPSVPEGSETNDQARVQSGLTPIVRTVKPEQAWNWKIGDTNRFEIYVLYEGDFTQDGRTFKSFRVYMPDRFERWTDDNGLHKVDEMPNRLKYVPVDRSYDRKNFIYPDEGQPRIKQIAGLTVAHWNVSSYINEIGANNFLPNFEMHTDVYDAIKKRGGVDEQGRLIGAFKRILFKVTTPKGDVVGSNFIERQHTDLAALQNIKTELERLIRELSSIRSGDRAGMAAETHKMVAEHENVSVSELAKQEEDDENRILKIMADLVNVKQEAINVQYPEAFDLRSFEQKAAELQMLAKMELLPESSMKAASREYVASRFQNMKPNEVKSLMDDVDGHTVSVDIQDAVMVANAMPGTEAANVAEQLIIERLRPTQDGKNGGEA